MSSGVSVVGGNRAGVPLKGFENVNIAGNAGNLIKMLQQLQGQAAPNQLDQAALEGLNASERDVSNLYQKQLEGWGANVGGSLVNQMQKARTNLSARGLGNVIPQLGDMGTDRQYNLTMGALKDDWMQNRLNHMAGLSKQRAQVNSRAGSRVASLLGQLSGTASDLFRSRTSTSDYATPGRIAPATGMMVGSSI
jgi:hypothetical protein